MLKRYLIYLCLEMKPGAVCMCMCGGDLTQQCARPRKLIYGAKLDLKNLVFRRNQMAELGMAMGSFQGVS